MFEFSEYEEIAIQLGYKKVGKYYELQKDGYTHQIWFIKEYECIRLSARITNHLDTSTYNSGVFRADKLNPKKFQELLEFFLSN